MRRNSNIYCILLLAVLTISVGYEFYQIGKEIIAFSKSELEDVEYAKTHKGFALLTTTIKVKDKAGIQNLSYFNIENTKMGTDASFRPETMTIKTAYPSSKSSSSLFVFFMFFVAWGYIALIVWFLVCFVKIIIRVNKGENFSDEVTHRLNKMGWISIALYFTEWVINIGTYFDESRIISFKEYEMVMETPNYVTLWIGLGLLIFSQLFKIGTQMKQEQELTI